MCIFSKILNSSGLKSYGRYNPFVVAVGIVVLLLLLISLGICLYSCSWSYFLDVCVTGILFGFNSDDNSDSVRSTDLQQAKNNLDSDECPPCYETLDRIPTIYNPHDIAITNYVNINIDAPPPNYEDILPTSIK